MNGWNLVEGAVLLQDQAVLNCRLSACVEKTHFLQSDQLGAEGSDYIEYVVPRWVGWTRDPVLSVLIHPGVTVLTAGGLEMDYAVVQRENRRTPLPTGIGSKALLI